MKAIARSPSQTEDWLKCPIYRTLNYRFGLKPRHISKGELSAFGGRAFAKAMEVYNLNTGDPIDAAMQELKDARTQAFDKGRYIRDGEMVYNDGLEGRIRVAVTKYMANDPIRNMGFRVEDVELTLKEHGNARIDLGVRDDFGLSIIDYKLKFNLKAYYLDKEIERYRNSWQQFHYAWAYGEYKQEPINNYYICMVVIEPKFSAKLYEFPIHPESLEMWKASAHRIWTQMEHEDAGLVEPWMAARHEDQFGPCQYQAACFTHRYDMNLMTQDDYVIVKEVD